MLKGYKWDSNISCKFYVSVEKWPPWSLPCLSLESALISPTSFFFSFIFISWRLISLQYCSGFCHTLTWISHGFTCIPQFLLLLNSHDTITQWRRVKITWSPILTDGEGNGNPLQYSCLENPRDRGAWWAAIYGVAQIRTQLKWLSMHACIGEGNGNPLQCSCLEGPRDRGAWWAAIYGVAQNWTRLKWLSSSSSSPDWLPISSTTPCKF